MPAVVTSIEKPASVTVIKQEVADVVVSQLRASDVGKSVCPLLFGVGGKLFRTRPHLSLEYK